jgi:CheY-like chemotaxis protein
MSQDIVAIIDDQPLVQIGLKAVLKSMGCSVVCFTSPIEALEGLELVGPDCVVVDLMMPEMDGIEFVKQFRRRFQNVHVPIILSSAFLDNEVLGRAFDAGVDDFLEKPAGSVLIRQRVRNMLRMRHLEALCHCGEGEDSRIDNASHNDLDASMRVLDRDVTENDSSADVDMKKAIHVATATLEKICRDIDHSHSSIASPPLELKLSTFSPDSLMETCCRSLGSELADKHLTLDCTLDSTLAWMVGDKKLLTGALTKMMTTVIKQSSRKARIGIRMKRVQGPGIEMSVRSSSSQSVVTDTASAINESMMAHAELKGAGSHDGDDTFWETVAKAHGGGMGTRVVAGNQRECYLTIPLYGSSSEVKSRIIREIDSSVV